MTQRFLKYEAKNNDERGAKDCAERHQKHIVRGFMFAYKGIVSRGAVGLFACAECQDFLVGKDIISDFCLLYGKAKPKSSGESCQENEQAGKARCGVFPNKAVVCFADGFFHGFHVSFYQFVDRDIEGNTEQKQTLNIGVRACRFPIRNGLAGNVDFSASASWEMPSAWRCFFICPASSISVASTYCSLLAYASLSLPSYSRMTCSEKLYHPTISTWRIVVGLTGVKILYQVNDRRLFENSLIDFVLFLGEVEGCGGKAFP